MNKVYAVVEFGGEYEDSWEHTIGICSTVELADLLKEYSIQSHKPKVAKISEEEWSKINEEMYNREEVANSDEDFETLVPKYYPQYTSQDVSEAICAYDLYDDYFDTVIREIPFFTNEEELPAYGNNY